MPENKEYITRVGKILSRQKNPDRITLVSIFKPQDRAQKDHGVIYLVIEILCNDVTIGRVAKIIEKTLIDKYYENIGDGLESFEASLKAINEKLAKLADEGEIGWIGKVNAVIAIMERNILHITQVGTVEAYLIRENKITHITENLSTPSERPNPLKTFVNIASGDLNIKDKIILSTSELFYHFSLDDLRRINAKFPPAVAAAYIVKMLRREEIESINTLILELDESDEETGIGKKLLLEEQHLVEQYNQKIVPAWKKFLSFSKKGAKKSFDKTKEVYGAKIAPSVSKFAQEANKRVDEKFSKIVKTSTNTETINGNKDKNLFGIFSKAPKINVKEEKLDVPLFERPGKKSNKKAINNDSQTNIFEAPKNTPVRRIVISVSRTYILIKESVSKSKKKSQFFMTLSVLLIVILVTSGTISYQRKAVTEKKTKIEQSYNDLKNKVDGAMKAFQLGDVKKSQSLLSESKNDAAALASSSYMKDQISALTLEITNDTETVFNIQRFENITPLVNFAQTDQTIKVSNLAKVDTKIITTDKERHKGLSFSLDTKTIDAISPLAFDGTIDKIVPLSDKSTLAMLASDPSNVYIYNAKTVITEKTKQITDDPWPKANAIASYLNNIYLLVPTDGQIYRYTSLINSYSAKSSYIVDKSIDLTNAVDLAIDGSVYVLMKNGDVLKFSSGTKIEFALHGMPEIFNEKEKSPDTKMLEPIRIIASDSTSSLYIVDRGAKRVIVFDKDGAYKTQYVSSKWNDIKDFVVDGKTGYLLSGTELYQIDLK